MTHLGVPADQLVLLEAIGVKASPDLREQLAFYRTMPADGSNLPFTHPQNQALILTEVDWQFELGVPNGTVSLRVFLTWPLGSSGSGSTAASSRAPPCSAARVGVERARSRRPACLSRTA